MGSWGGFQFASNERINYRRTLQIFFVLQFQNRGKGRKRKGHFAECGKVFIARWKVREGYRALGGRKEESNGVFIWFEMANYLQWRFERVLGFTWFGTVEGMIWKREFVIGFKVGCQSGCVGWCETVGILMLAALWRD
jgi:hypothetical protein